MEAVANKVSQRSKSPKRARGVAGFGFAGAAQGVKIGVGTHFANGRGCRLALGVENTMTFPVDIECHCVV